MNDKQGTEPDSLTFRSQFLYMESGWDPDIKKYFTRLLNAISVALAWLIAVFSAGIYFRLGWPGNYPLIFTIIFYTTAAVTLFFVIRYMKGLWDKGTD